MILRAQQRVYDSIISELRAVVRADKTLDAQTQCPKKTYALFLHILHREPISYRASFVNIAKAIRLLNHLKGTKERVRTSQIKAMVATEMAFEP